MWRSTPVERPSKDLRRGRPVIPASTLLAAAALFFFHPAPAPGEPRQGVKTGEASPAADLSRPLPLDTGVTSGRLKNGLTYFIRTNRKPEKRAELRLVVNAGSVLEDEDQRGLAHFVEHMAFNGTAHFRKQELVSYLESAGMRFGPDVNAYTGFEETVYMLQIPTDSAEIVKKSFVILEDWAHTISFDDDEVEKERGVIIEEWRLGRGAGARMRDKQFPFLFKDSKYAERLPIGLKPIIEKCRPETLRRFYRTWYRPEQMAVIAVGDFDRSSIEQLIREQFSGIEPAKQPQSPPSFPVPDHDQTLYAIATDSEATLSSVSIDYLHEVEAESTEADYRRTLIGALYNSMLNQRLGELTKKPDPPFLFASSSYGNLVRTKSAYSLEAGVRDGGIPRGMETILKEARKVKLYGFTQAELDRQKKDFLRFMEEAYRERDKTESEGLASELIRHYLEKEPVPGIAFEFELYKKYLPEISLSEIDQFAARWMTDRNRVVLVNAPEKRGLETPEARQLAAVFDSANASSVEAYADTVSGAPLLAAPPAPGTLADQKEVVAVGVTEWRLSNGIRVILRPTDFKNDEVIFSAFSPGGSSVVPDSEYIPAVTATSIVEEGGVAGFDAITLQKMLAGKVVSVSPNIGELDEGLSGNSAPRDLETMFQLIYLYFTAPRADSSAYLAYRSRIKAYLQNRSSRPESAFEDTVGVTLSQYHPRRQPWTEKLFGQMDLQSSLNIYRDRFADASDFTFLFVGNITPDQIRPYVLQYLGSLPALRRNERWRDIGVRPPKGVIEKSVHKGIEPKSQVEIIFTGPFEWSQGNRYILNSLSSTLEIRLREILREEKGGTYGVSVSGSTEHYPVPGYSFRIGFSCAPERVEELSKSMFAEIKRFKESGVEESYVAKVKETQRRERETDKKTNGFWLSYLGYYYQNEEDPANINRYDALVAGLTPGALQEAARRYLDMKNYVDVVLYPRQ